ncbi:MAG: GTPase ObgE [Dehalococcoidia bacterium]|nr:GTPase ObgE [Dehalococcoidia bacterium]
MIDRVEIYVKAGDGGNGIASFRREKFVPFGGPDGGDGGDGGSVWLAGDSSVSTLQDFRYRSRFKAQRGGHGKGKNMTGKKGEDLSIKVPLGTVVRRKGEGGSGEVVADIVEQGQRILIARGGKGGLGNTRFATSTNQAPRRATPGKPGEEASLVLDLKLIADAGIVGYPNAGKSTLLSRVSRARPKIGHYPFTTTEPMLGVVEAGGRSFLLADIPGIVEGAHKGKGLGLEFLRHVERTRVLIHVVDGGVEDPLSDFKKVEAEFAAYPADLKQKPRIIAVNKIDLTHVRERRAALEGDFDQLNMPLHFISAATGEGVDGLIRKVLEILTATRPVPAAPEEETKVFRPRPVSSRKSAGEENRRHG